MVRPAPGGGLTERTFCGSRGPAPGPPGYFCQEEAAGGGRDCGITAEERMPDIVMRLEGGGRRGGSA